tara:strand:- start:555 stop:875 length:321 start_codon:yes stop_codon:yes gene_type:complete
MTDPIKPRKDGKYIVQVLLPPASGKLYAEHISKDFNMQPSKHANELIQKYLKKTFPKEYKKILLADAENWKEIVSKRTEGREKAKLKKVEAKIDSVLKLLQSDEDS